MKLKCLGRSIDIFIYKFLQKGQKTEGRHILSGYAFKSVRMFCGLTVHTNQANMPRDELKCSYLPVISDVLRSEQ